MDTFFGVVFLIVFIVGFIAYHNWAKEEDAKKAERKKAQIGAIRASGDKPLSCPQCGSTQISAGKKGFGLGKAAAGGLLVGPAGLLGGFIGSKKVMVTCLKCGFSWRAGAR